MSRHPTSALVGLEIDDGEVRLAVATPSGDGHAVQCHRRALPAGAVESGRIADEEAVLSALRAVLAAAEPRPRRLGLVLGRRAVCRVEPVADPQDPSVVSACGERMRRYVVFGGQPTIVGHTLQGGSSGGSGPARLLSAAALRDLVLRQAAVAKRCGLTVVRAEPGMAVLVRALLAGAAASPSRPRFLMVASDDGCEIGLVRQDGLIFCQRLAVAAAALARDGDVLTATLELLEDYHLRHAGGREPIEELLWCGAAPGLDGLFDRLAAAGILTTWLDPAALPGVARFECEGIEGPAERSALAPVVAEALSGASDAGHLDLLPPPPKKSVHGLLAPWLVVPALLTFLATSGLVAGEWVLRRQAARLTDMINHPTPEMVECLRLQGWQSALRQRRADAELLLASVARWAGPAFVEELARRLPEDVWLDRLEVGRNGQGVIEGMAQAEEAVFALAESLRRSPAVESVRMAGAGTERDGGLILSRFRLEVTLARQGGRPDETRPSTGSGRPEPAEGRPGQEGRPNE